MDMLLKTKENGFYQPKELMIIVKGINGSGQIVWKEKSQLLTEQKEHKNKLYQNAWNEQYIKINRINYYFQNVGNYSLTETLPKI